MKEIVTQHKSLSEVEVTELDLYNKALGTLRQSKYLAHKSSPSRLRVVLS